MKKRELFNSKVKAKGQAIEPRDEISRMGWKYRFHPADWTGESATPW